MTYKELVTTIANREGKKAQVSVGNVREVLAHLSDIIIEDPTAIEVLIKNGKRRRKR